MYRALIHLSLWLVFLQLGGCASLARYPDNPPLERFDSERSITHMESQGSGDILLILTFSGGGSRAAALAYGVLEALADTPLAAARGTQSMLQEVDMISSVSGGSITAAYYGLYGDRLFEDFRNRFLERDVNSELTNRMLTPGTLSRLSSETFGSGDVLDEYFREQLFGTAALRELVDANGPFVQINATDLFKGGQFGFTPEQFALICSDIDRFPVSRAVAASSAVPLVFAPITLTNRAGGCDYRTPPWLQQGLRERGSNDRRYRMASYLNAYLEQQAHPYIHLVDGGLSDNLGLRAVMDHIVINGGLWNTLQRFNLQGARHIVLITVDASALLPSQWEQSDATPSSFAILDAATTTPLANYNFETLEFLRSNLLAWRNELEQRSCAGKAGCSAPGVYLIELRLEEIADPALRKRLTSIPTDFSLAPDVVDELIAAGHQLLNQNTQYRNLLKAIEPASR
jgi:NTE family protein